MSITFAKPSGIVTSSKMTPNSGNPITDLPLFFIPELNSHP